MADKIPNKPLSFVLGKDVPTKKGELQFANKFPVEELENLLKEKIEKERAEKKEEQDCSEHEKE